MPTPRKGLWIHLCALLLHVCSGSAMVLFSRSANRVVDASADLMVWGRADRCSALIHQALRAARHAGQWPPPLQRILDEGTPHGLRYLALVGGDDPQRVLAAGDPAREPAWPLLTDPRPAGLRLRAATRARVYGPELRGWRHGPRLIFEVDPAPANQARSEARAVLIVGWLVGLLLIGSGGALSWLWWRKELIEENLRRQRSLAELGKMSAVVAHELRTPLTALKGHAELLLEALPAEGAARERAARVVAAAARLTSLNRDLLEFVRAGTVCKGPADPAAVLQRAAAALGPAPLTLRCPALPPCALDAGRLEQALLNLLHNAAQANPGGPIEAAVTIEGAGPSARLIYSVRDHGPGVPPAEVERIFEPFCTLRASGVGLGLAVVRHIAALHQGAAWVEPAVGGGACFYLALPAAIVLK